jgi:Alginate export
MRVLSVGIITAALGIPRLAAAEDSLLQYADPTAPAAQLGKAEAEGQQKPKPPPSPPKPYKPVFYDNDFSYLDKPDNPYWHPTDLLKRIRFDQECCEWVTDIGGEFRLRVLSEENRRLNGKFNDYDLVRTRVFVNSAYDKRFRIYAEFIDANSEGEDEPPLATDVNRTDLQNLFADIRLLTCEEDRSLTLRAGRQELLYGNQRLISPPDWSNTRRSWEGFKLLWQSKDWSIDGFWTRPIVPVDPAGFDHGNSARQFGGTYGTYKGYKDQVLDLYYLVLLEEDIPVPGRPKGVVGSGNLHTLGSRWQGKADPWLWEFEGALQFGEQLFRTRVAGMATAGVGRKFDHCWKPELWFYYDYASGDRDPTDDHDGTFNPLFPLGHKYFGYLDIVGRQNIHDLNVLGTLQPHEKLTLTAWYHVFRLDQARDALYGVTPGSVQRRDPTGRAGTDVGQEIDLLSEFVVGPHCFFQVGYSHFFSGEFIQRTGFGGDAEFVYTQIYVRF